MGHHATTLDTDGYTYCEPDTDNPDCGFYENWNDLGKYYIGLDNERFLDKKQWEYIGCSLDVNYFDELVW